MKYSAMEKGTGANGRAKDLSPTSCWSRLERWTKHHKHDIRLVTITTFVWFAVFFGGLAILYYSGSSALCPRPGPGPVPTTTTTPYTTTTTPTTTPTPTTSTTPSTNTTTSSTTTTTPFPETTTFYPTKNPLPDDAVHVAPEALLYQMDMNPKYTQIICANTNPVLPVQTFKFNVTVEGGHTYTSPGADSKVLARKAVAMVASESLFGLHYPDDVPIPSPTYPCDEK